MYYKKREILMGKGGFYSLDILQMLYFVRMMIDIEEVPILQI